MKQRANKPVVRYADPHIAVVDKPAGLTTMRHGYEAAEFGPRARRYLPRTRCAHQVGCDEEPVDAVIDEEPDRWMGGAA